VPSFDTLMLQITASPLAARTNASRFMVYAPRRRGMECHAAATWLTGTVDCVTARCSTSSRYMSTPSSSLNVRNTMMCSFAKFFSDRWMCLVYLRTKGYRSGTCSINVGERSLRSYSRVHIPLVPDDRSIS
jgi:hypothetical protein